METDTPAESAVAPCSPFLNQLISDWYESSPYCEQVPDPLVGQLVAFMGKHGVVIDADQAWEIIDSPIDQEFLPLFETIFLEGARYALSQMANAVYDRDAEKLKQIDLVPADVGFRSSDETGTAPAPDAVNASLLHGLIELGGREDSEGRFRVTLEYDNYHDGAIVLDGDGNRLGECYGHNDAIPDDDNDSQVQWQYCEAITAAINAVNDRAEERKATPPANGSR